MKESIKFGELISSHRVILLLFCDNLTLDSEAPKTSRSLAAGFGSLVKIIKINHSENEELANALRIKSNPTYFLYKNGKEVERIEGNFPEHSLKDKLTNLLND